MCAPAQPYKFKSSVHLGLNCQRVHQTGGAGSHTKDGQSQGNAVHSQEHTRYNHRGCVTAVQLAETTYTVTITVSAQTL